MLERIDRGTERLHRAEDRFHVGADERGIQLLDVGLEVVHARTDLHEVFLEGAGAGADTDLLGQREGIDGLGVLGLDSREDHLGGHVTGASALDADAGRVVLEENLVAALEFALGHDAVLLEEGGIFLLGERLEGLQRVGRVGESALRGLFDPAGLVAVAVEDDALVRLQDVLEDLLQRGMERSRVLAGLRLASGAGLLELDRDTLD